MLLVAARALVKSLTISINAQHALSVALQTLIATVRAAGTVVNGSLLDVTITSEEVRFGDRPARLVLATDITRETEAEMALLYLAHHDALTGALNRVGLDLAFQGALAIAGHSGTGGAVLFLDLNGFKAINDCAGHTVGDALLVCVARRLAAAARQDDVVARIGGDEFVMVVPGRAPCHRNPCSD